MLEIGQVLAARYALLRRLNAGSWGEVWLARDGDRDVALKVLAPALAADAAARARFLATAQLQAGLRDPSILPCETVIDGDPCLAVYPYVPGGDMSSLRGRAWPILVPVLARVARAVSLLNSEGYVHRDLKPANVVLGASGQAVLADLGVAARIGEPNPLPPGSPFSASPQQLAGEPPTVADDVYGFGALAYELLSGYPPFYPDEAAARASEQPPPPVLARAPLPEELQRLVLACLARTPAGRPAGLAAVAEQLDQLPLPGPHREPAPVPPSAGGVRPPQDAPAPIEPRWRRNDEGTAGEQHGGRQRRLLIGGAFALLLAGVMVVIFVLPRLVPAPPVAAPSAEDAAAVEAARAEARKAEQRDLRRLAELKHEYEQKLPPLRERHDKLVARAADEWGGEPFARARKNLDSAAVSFTAREYEQALASLAKVEPDLAATEAAAAVALRAALEAGAAALASGNAAEAARQYTLALKVSPGHAQATRGLERSRHLDEVRALLADAERLESEGQVAAASDAWRKVLALDRENAVAQQSLARVASAQSNAAFSTAMSDGLAALAAGDVDRARSGFERAAQLRPGSSEAADGLAQVARLQGSASIAGLLAAAERAEREERWQAAHDSWRKALAIDGNLLAAQQGVERTEPRAALEAQLNGFAARPDRLFSTEVRAAARSAVGRAASIAPRGPVLERQIVAVTAMIEAAEVPVAIALTSDNQTDVTIYRVGRIGQFERKDMELLPGRYTIVGTRTGFRDVRRELTVLPGQAPPAVTIRCEDPI